MAWTQVQDKHVGRLMVMSLPTKDGQNISGLNTETPNTTSASEVGPQSHTTGRTYGESGPEVEEECEDSDGG